MIGSMLGSHDSMTIPLLPIAARLLVAQNRHTSFELGQTSPQSDGHKWPQSSFLLHGSLQSGRMHGNPQGSWQDLPCSQDQSHDDIQGWHGFTQFRGQLAWLQAVAHFCSMHLLQDLPGWQRLVHGWPQRRVSRHLSRPNLVRIGHATVQRENLVRTREKGSNARRRVIFGRA